MLGIKTDSCVCIFNNDEFPFILLDDKNLDGYFYDNENTKPMYKIEEAKRLTFERMGYNKRRETFNKQENELVIINDVEDNDFNPLIKQMINANSSILINGPPGSGKTTLINEIQKRLTKKKKKKFRNTNKYFCIINSGCYNIT